MSRLQHTILVGTVWLVAALAAPAQAACPTSARFEPTSDATSDAGWTGLAHHEPVFGTTLDLALDCAATDPPCGTCPITGIVAAPTGHRLRCRNDTSIQCSFATEVADCGSPGACAYHLSPPQPIGAAGAPFCLTTELDGLPSGSVDVETGAFAPTVPVTTRFYQGYATPGTPPFGIPRGCPRCVGDPVPDDGIRGGTCEGGSRAGLACDANGTSPLSDFGSVSFDCPIALQVAALHTTMAFATTPQTITLSAASPHCTGGFPPAPFCFCDTCNDLAGEPCARNADCPMNGGNPGICGGKRCLGGDDWGAPCAGNSDCASPGICGRLGEPTRPHPCIDDSATGTCTPDGMGGGFCADGPVFNQCSNHPDRGCTNDADCDGVPGTCLTILRPCFPDNGVDGGSVDVGGAATIPVAGVADPTDLGTLSCLGSSGYSWVNAIWGLPGLSRTYQPGRLALGDAPPGPTPTATPLSTATPTPSPAMCPAMPAACRTPVVTGKASLQIVDRTPDDKDQLAWKWLRGADTNVADFGDPTATNSYALCLYDGTGLRAALRVPAGGTCGGKPCWRAKPGGFLYKRKDAAPDGLTQLTLKAGPAGKAQIQARGRGALLPVPAPSSVTGTVMVQLRNEVSGLCFGATYVPPFDTLIPERLKDRAD